MGKSGDSYLRVGLFKGDIRGIRLMVYDLHHGLSFFARLTYQGCQRRSKTFKDVQGRSKTVKDAQDDQRLSEAIKDCQIRHFYGVSWTVKLQYFILSETIERPAAPLNAPERPMSALKYNRNSKEVSD